MAAGQIREQETACKLSTLRSSPPALPHRTTALVYGSDPHAGRQQNAPTQRTEKDALVLEQAHMLCNAKLAVLPW